MSELTELILKIIIGLVVVVGIRMYYQGYKPKKKILLSETTQAHLSKMELELEEAVLAYLKQGKFEDLFSYCTEDFLNMIAMSFTSKGYVDKNRQQDILQQCASFEMKGSNCQIEAFKRVDENTVIISVSHEKSPFQLIGAEQVDYVLIRENNHWKFDVMFLRYHIQVLNKYPEEGHILYCCHLPELGEVTKWHIGLPGQKELKEGEHAYIYCFFDYYPPMDHYIRHFYFIQTDEREGI